MKMELDLDLNPTYLKFFLKMIKIRGAKNPKTQVEEWIKHSIKKQNKRVQTKIEVLNGIKNKTKITNTHQISSRKNKGGVQKTKHPISEQWMRKKKLGNVPSNYTQNLGAYIYSFPNFSKHHMVSTNIGLLVDFFDNLLFGY